MLIQDWKTFVFIKKAKKIHGNKYDYSKSIYVNYDTKIKIICKIHGQFEQTPDAHLCKKSGCRLCVHLKQKLTIDEFIQKANIFHDYKYNYSKSKYINNRTKVKIICKTHGEFEQIPNSHLNGSGCPNCATTKKLTTQVFIKKSKAIHKNKYDYSEFIYVNAKTKGTIVCKVHGEFLQTPSDHLQGKGCIKCGGRYMDIFLFIKKAKIMHNNFYIYSDVKYLNAFKKIKIICPVHGEFLQNPNNHLNGQGCPICKTSKGEKEISKVLKNKNIIFTSQKSFNKCIGIGYRVLKFDFYIEKYNLCIEYDGKLHFETYGGKNKLKYKIKLFNIEFHDILKSDYCWRHKIKLLRIPYWEMKNISQILDKYFDKLERKINKNKIKNQLKIAA